MKLSATTILVLANLAKINQHIVINPGNKLRSVDEKGTKLVSATITEEFPVEVALHDLSGFLRVLDLFDEPELDFHEKHVIISDEGSKQKYYYSEKEELLYNDKEPRELEYELEFNLTDSQLSKVLKAAQVNNVEDIAFVGEEGGVFLKAMNKEDPKRTFSVKVSDEDIGDFIGFLKQTKKTKLNLIALDYVVKISRMGVINFSTQIDDVQINYTIAMERDSEL